MSPMSNEERLLDHEARIAVLERKSDRRTAVIAMVTSMISAVGTVLAALLMSGCFVPSPERPTAAEIRDHRANVVRLTSRDLDTGLPDGVATGTFMAPDRILTAGHVCGDGSVLTAEAANGTHFLVYPLMDADDRANDLCVLSTVLYTSPTYARLSAVPPQFADVLWYVGYPEGALAVHIGRAGENVDEDEIILHDAVGGLDMSAITTIPGASGSAVMNQDGLVVGVISQASYDGDLGFYVILPYIREALEIAQ